MAPAGLIRKLCEVGALVSGCHGKDGFRSRLQRIGIEIPLTQPTMPVTQRILENGFFVASLAQLVLITSLISHRGTDAASEGI
ncbi:hypothetical protein DAMNIGENAA_26350 [Desulforhabdus amnigena]|uniref:Uncharacterized protein n=1 Tax=Desulforhabdus amnigena TaxID=40218 RepID=A0A9W6L830_9BACT|nr:hypothetical protein DAMNIGENAA_26350 [Desulforhabdus amnigena]